MLPLVSLNRFTRASAPASARLAAAALAAAATTHELGHRDWTHRQRFTAVAAARHAPRNAGAEAGAGRQHGSCRCGPSLGHPSQESADGAVHHELLPRRVFLRQLPGTGSAETQPHRPRPHRVRTGSGTAGGAPPRRPVPAAHPSAPPTGAVRWPRRSAPLARARSAAPAFGPVSSAFHCTPTPHPARGRAGTSCGPPRPAPSRACTAPRSATATRWRSACATTRRRSATTAASTSF